MGGGEQISAHLAKILFRLGQIKGSVTVELAHPFIPFVQILGGVLLVVVIMVSFLLEDKSNQYSSVDGDQPVSWKQVLAVIFIWLHVTNDFWTFLYSKSLYKMNKTFFLTYNSTKLYLYL